MRLLVSGDRFWTNVKAVQEPMLTLPPDTVLIHGRARGLDTIAARIAKERGLTVDLPPVPGDPQDKEQLGGYPALWAKYGKPAGPIRNTRMLKEGKPDTCWAWHASIATSSGTKDMIRQCLAAGIAVRLFTGKEEYELLIQDDFNDLLQLPRQLLL